MINGGQTFEESFLTSNVPGRYSKWTDYAEEARSDRDDESNHPSESQQQVWNDEPDGYKSEEEDPLSKAIDEKRQAEEAKVSEKVREAIKRGHRPGPQTGPKGVLADYKAFKIAEYQQSRKEEQNRYNVLRRIALGAEVSAPVEASSKSLQNVNLPNDEMDEEEAEENDYLAQYRARRLQELQAASTLPTFGEIQEVTAYEFLDGINETDSRTAIIVHIYDPHLKPCATLNRHLETLARKYSHVRFMRLPAHAHPSMEFDPIALPLLVIYRNGDVEDCLARVHETFGDGFTCEDVDWLLESKGVFEKLVPHPMAHEEPVGGVQSSRTWQASEG